LHRNVPHSELTESIRHIRDLHRQISLSDVEGRQRYARREQKTKDLLSNLNRSASHPTLTLVREFGELNSMTVDAAHRLFGYDLDAIREVDLLLNGNRTHIVESFVYGRDVPVQLPLELARPEAFTRTAALASLVRQWQEDIPIRSLSRPDWRRAKAFYVHVGTEDSLGSDLPPGSLALVEPIEADSVNRLDPKSIYLIQFPNGYRCSRCIVTRGKLHLLSSTRRHYDTTVYAYPGSARVVGRVGMFAASVPIQQHSSQRSLSHYKGDAPLVLPWEQLTRGALLATKYRRFVRTPEDRDRVNKFLQEALQWRVSERSKRRYRAESNSEPHIGSLIHMALEAPARYADLLRVGGYRLRDYERFSLDSLLGATRLDDVIANMNTARAPFPADVWAARRREIAEWPAILSLKFPRLQPFEDLVIRIADERRLVDLEPPLSRGSWLLIEKPADLKTPQAITGRGWSRPLYVLRRGLEMIVGHLNCDGDQYALMDGVSERDAYKLAAHEVRSLSKVCGVAVPL